MQEETEKREIPTPAILLTMLAQLNDKAFEKEVSLQCEESGANIAKLQGFLAGVRKYKQLMRENGYTFDIKFDGTTERKLSFFGEDGCKLDLHELRVTVSDIDDLADSVAYNEFKELWHNAVETQKDWLFYTSEKGRDLHFAKGWYEAMTEIDNNMQRKKKPQAACRLTITTRTQATTRGERAQRALKGGFKSRVLQEQTDCRRL